MPKKPHSKTYRADIDGLRAIAVLSVIAYHIDEGLVPAGFIGVDIFFVISGYLISLMIMNEIKEKRFSLSEFYRRRIKRIAPALLFVLAITVIAAQFLFRPQDAENTARAGLWSLLSLANLFFWLFEDTSYFAPDTKQLPLLHLWSLGVEEQFYLLWPIFLLGFYSAKRAVSFAWLLGFAAFASFVFGQFYYVKDPSFVYYMLPARAGELIIGALAALHVIHKRSVQMTPLIIGILATSGAILVSGSLVFISSEAPFPGFQAIPPVLGTALLIVAGHYGQSIPTRLLSCKILVGIGLVSYAAYLWHWPLLAFLNYGGFSINVVFGIGVFLLTFLLAWLTYRWVEQPFRRSNQPLIPLAIKQYIVPAGLIGIIIGLSMKSDGYVFRGGEYKKQLTELRQQRRSSFFYDYVCQKRRIESEDLKDPRCVLGEPANQPPTALLWGDSNAAHYVGMIGALAREAGFRFRNIEVGSCPPLNTDPTLFVRIENVEHCAHSNQLIWADAANYHTVIIAASWNHYHYKGGDIIAEFEQTLATLSKTVPRTIVLGKSSIVTGYKPLCKEKALGFPFVECSDAAVPLSEKVIDVNERLQEMVDRYPDVHYFDANPDLCPQNLCELYDENGAPNYYDAEHMTIDTSWRLGEKIIQNRGVPNVFRDITKD